MTVRNLRSKSADLLRCVFSGQNVPWPADLSAEVFFQEAAAQGMVPLLFRRISKQDSSGWPAELLTRLKETSLRQAVAELRLEADLRVLLQAFFQADIQPLLLKGTAFAYSLYPEPWLRPRCDTDLLITESEREKTAVLLRQFGSAPLFEAIDMEHLGFGSEMHYVKTMKHASIIYDIHWKYSHINRKFSTEFTECGLQTTSLPALGNHARTLSKIDSLLYACFHRAGHFSHSGDRLIWLHDIHLLCQSLTDEEAGIFCAKARRLEIITLCADAIAVAQSWFNTAVPQPLTDLMQTKVEGETFSSLLLPGGRQVGIKNHALLELQGLPNWRKRIRFLFQNAFPPPEFMRWRYGRTGNSPLPLLYLKRFTEAVHIFLKK